MIKTSSKYLRDEFKTSVNPEMVSVNGRVLPAPTITLGKQDPPLVPRDGTWDMRDKQFYQGAHIKVWALACFAPSKWCDGEVLRRFSNQMASVSSREGMTMTNAPVDVRYAERVHQVRAQSVPLRRAGTLSKHSFCEVLKTKGALRKLGQVAYLVLLYRILKG